MKKEYQSFVISDPISCTFRSACGVIPSRPGSCLDSSACDTLVQVLHLALDNRTLKIRHRHAVLGAYLDLDIA